MSRREYQASLEALRLDVQRMGALVLERPDQSPSAREHNDTGVAAKIIEGDDEISQRSLGLESTCIGTFARQQPVANVRRSIAARTLYPVETEPELLY